MRLLEARADRTVEITLSDDSELVGRIGEVSSDQHFLAFELEVAEEYEDGSVERQTFIINWDDVRFLRDINSNE